MLPFFNMTVNYEKRKKAIWADHERAFGCLIAQPFRDAVEKQLKGTSPDDDTFLEDLDAAIPGYLELMKAWGASNAGSSASDGGSTKAKPQRTYRKCFERRFYLVDFVMANSPIDLVRTMKEWHETHRFHLVDREHDGRRLRIDWRQTVAEWNTAHPSDVMSLAVLKAEYYRAIREDALMWQFFLYRSQQLMANAWQPLKKRLSDLYKNGPLDVPLITAFGIAMRQNSPSPMDVSLAGALGEFLQNHDLQRILAVDEDIRSSPLFTRNRG